MSGPRTRRLPVAPEPLLADSAYDYADCFEVRMPTPDPRSAEDLVREGLERAGLPVRLTVLLAHRYLLRLRLGPQSAPDHILGWRIVSSQPNVVQVEAASPLLGRGVIVGRRPDPTTATITAFVFYARPASRLVWTLVSPLHRLIAPYLMARAARVEGDVAAPGN